MSAKDPAPQIAEGEERLAAGDLNGAIVAFQCAVAVASSSAVAHSKLGVCYVHAQRLDEAAASFSRAIQLDPTYAPAYSNLGNVCRERGQLDQAVAHYQKAISMDPDYWIAHQNLGIVYKQQGRVAEAVREFKTATRLSLRAPASGRPARAPVDAGRRMGCLGTASVILLLGIILARLR